MGSSYRGQRSHLYAKRRCNETRWRTIEFLSSNDCQVIICSETCTSWPPNSHRVLMDTSGIVGCQWSWETQTRYPINPCDYFSSTGFGMGRIRATSCGVLMLHSPYMEMRGAMTLGQGALISFSAKQKINTKSSTESEVAGVDDSMPLCVWALYFSYTKGSSWWKQHQQRIWENATSYYKIIPALSN